VNNGLRNGRPENGVISQRAIKSRSLNAKIIEQIAKGDVTKVQPSGKGGLAKAPK
jgi:hypothetical protein